MLSHISLYLHIRDISLQYHTAQKELNCCTLDIRCALHVVFLAIQATVCIQARVAFSNGKSCYIMFLFKSSVYRPSGTSLLKALFLV